MSRTPERSYADTLICMGTQARAVLLHGLADPSRLALIEALVDGPRRVSDLVQVTGLTQPNASRHLACLHECGLVERERHGREVHYRLIDGLEEVLAATDAVLARVGDRVMACPRYGLATSAREAQPA